MKHLSRIIPVVTLLGGGLWVVASAGPKQTAQEPEVKFQRAVQLETVEGDLAAAIDLYKQVVSNNGQNRALAAEALLRLGGCYEKQGNAEASRAYERLLREYGDQRESAAEARTRLAALRKPAAPGSGPSTRRVWSGSKTDFFGSVSPDGRYLSFVDWDTGDLAIHDLADGTDRRLTNKGSWEASDAEAESSIWSPDGKQLAYQWFRWDAEHQGYELRIVNLDEPNPRVLYRNLNSEEWIVPFDWSPDGKHILASLDRAGASQEIMLISVADGKLRTLKRFSQGVGPAGAAISPDGRYVAYDYPQSESSLAHDIYLLPITGGTEISLIEYPADDLVLGWSPDGKWVLFASDRRGSVDVWAIRTEEGKAQGAPVTVKPAIGRVTPLGFTRGGSIYFGVGGARNDVYVANLDPATGKAQDQPRKLVQHTEGFNRSPRYSPDGKFLAYISIRARTVFSAGTGWGDTLCIRSLESGEEREYRREMIRAGARGFSSPRWSPDGKSLLLFGRDYRARYGIYRLDLETGSAVNVLRAREDQFLGPAAGWRNESSFVYGRVDKKNDRGEICLRDLRDGSEKVLFAISPAPRGALEVSPDGKWVSATETYKSGEKAWRVVSTDTGEVRQLVKFKKEEQPGLIRHVWSADSKHVFYVRRSAAQGSQSWEVWSVSVDTGRTQRTGIEMAGPIDHMTAHPDGVHLAFENMAPMSASPNEVWVMENFLPLLKTGQK